MRTGVGGDEGSTRLNVCSSAEDGGSAGQGGNSGSEEAHAGVEVKVKLL